MFTSAYHNPYPVPVEFYPHPFNLFFCFNIIIPSVPVSSQSDPFHFTTSVLSLPIQAKCPAQLILLRSIIVY